MDVGQSASTDLTADEFERQYAQRSGVTVEWLREHGRVVKRCKCGDGSCQGWQSVSQDFVADEEADWAAGHGRKPDWID